jgi:formate-dependent nitrite reductase membrane component NrfD
VTAGPVVLLPPVAQRLWGWPAVVNFAAGGLGAGLYLAFAVAGTPAAARWLGPALVLAGFAAVAAEAGRPLRGGRVLARVRTSWMSRELWLGAAFAVAAALGVVLLAAPAAAALALAQGMILRRARGVPAWSAPILPAVFLTSALVSGAGLWLLLEAAAGRPPGDRAFAAVLVLVVVHAAISVRHVHAAPFAVLGHLGPAVLLAPALAWPGLAVPAAALAGILLITSQVGAKAALVIMAGRLVPITIPALAPRRRAS